MAYHINYINSKENILSIHIYRQVIQGRFFHEHMNQTGEKKV